MHGLCMCSYKAMHRSCTMDCDTLYLGHELLKLVIHNGLYNLLFRAYCKYGLETYIFYEHKLTMDMHLINGFVNGLKFLFEPKP